MKDLNNKKIVVTGGAGRLGSKFINYVINNFEDTKILSIDNYSTGNKDINIKNSIVNYKKMNSWHINRSTEMEHFNPDFVFHFGEDSSFNDSLQKSQDVLKSNLNGGFEVLEYCLKTQSKLFYPTVNYNGNQNDNPCAWSKYKIIELLENYKNWFGLDYEIISIEKIKELLNEE
jgi:UDP-glucose 4-epimerase